MEEEQKKTTALVEVKDEEKSLKEVGKRMLPKVTDGLKRIGKIVGYSTAALAGLTAAAVGGAPGIILGSAAFLKSVSGLAMNVLYKTEPSLMFVSQKRLGETKIFQGASLGINSKMKGYSKPEKAGMMGLQTLVGFARYKEDFKGSDYEIGEKGEKIYSRRISTQTHGVNIKNFQMLEALGYIKIDSIDTMQSNIARLLGRGEQTQKSLLVMERLGFGGYKDLVDLGKAFITRDRETLEKMAVKKQKISFRLTDKPIDFEDIYRKFSDLTQIQDRDEKTALRRLGVIFDHKRGILATKNIDLANDRFGRPFIKYNVRESFGQRINQAIRLEELDRSNIRDELRVDTNVEEVVKNFQEQQTFQHKEIAREGEHEQD